MKPSHILLSLCWLIPCLRADETFRDDQVTAVEISEVSIPRPIVDDSPARVVSPPAKPDFKVVESRTRRKYVTEPAPLPGLPPVSGEVNITVNRVEDPKLLPFPEPLPAASPDDPAVIAALAEMRQNHHVTEFVFVSATVYDHSRTFLRIYPEGAGNGQISAWSNIDFTRFSGFSNFRVTRKDGSFTDYGLIMGISNTDTARWKAFLESRGQRFVPPEIPELRDLAEAGPRYLVVEGRDSGSAALATLDHIHRLYSAEGERMEAAYLERERLRRERETHYLANPPKPKDVTINFWSTKREEGNE